MLWLRVFVGVLAVEAGFQNNIVDKAFKAYEAYDYDVDYDEVVPDPTKRELIDAVLAAAGAITEIVDFETYKDFYSVQKKFVSAVQNAKMNEKQFLSTLSFIKFFKDEVEKGKITLRHIKSFIASFKSGNLDEWMDTWDLSDLSRVPGIDTWL